MAMQYIGQPFTHNNYHLKNNFNFRMTILTFIIIANNTVELKLQYINSIMERSITEKSFHVKLKIENRCKFLIMKKLLRRNHVLVC